MGKNLDARMAKLQQQFDEVVGPPPPPPAEVAAKDAAWRALVERWARRLGESMHPEHRYLLLAWMEDFRRPCQHTPCPLPFGLKRHIDTLWSWVRDDSRPPALPASLVAAYLLYPRLPDAAMPHLDCEDCGSPVPMVNFYGLEKTPQEPQVQLFPRCPVCDGPWIGYHAYAIKHKEPGYGTLTPYSQRG